nr:RNA-directed DNA polymerase, eukaryota [Tanacetum cinerariifolium]
VVSWFRHLCNAQSDFAAKERIVWVDIEGVPLNDWSRLTFQKIASKWEEMVELEDGYDDLFARKRICIKTSQTENILESFKIIVKGKANSLNNGVEESDSEVVSDTYFGDNGVDQGLEHQHGESSNAKEVSNAKEHSISFGFHTVNENPASIKQDAPEVESDRPPNRSERSNSRVLKEVANSVDRSSSEVLIMGLSSRKAVLFWRF